MIGRNYKTVENCYSTGSISANGTDVKIGGVAGYDRGGARNCYYLSDSETDSFDGTTAKTATQFASGEVAFLLGEAFGQKLGENGDPYPVFATESNKVYAYLHCDGKTAKYTDDASLEDKTLSHTPGADDGDCTTDIPCTVCGQVATKGAETHTPAADDGDCTTDIPCTVCGQVATKGAETHTPAADDGDCTTAIHCSVCGTVTTEAEESHIGGTATCAAQAECDRCGTPYGDLVSHTPGEDDGDCTTDIPCTECGGIAIKGAITHTVVTASDHSMYCSACGMDYDPFTDGKHITINRENFESAVEETLDTVEDTMDSILGKIGENVQSAVIFVYDGLSKFFSNMLSGY